MPVRSDLWRIAAAPERLASAKLTSEAELEAMIVARPELLSPDWMLIGQQVQTFGGAKLDLLAIAPDGALVVIELKRDRTPREVVAQALDYATWVDSLAAEEIAGIYGRFRPGAGLSADFEARFGHALPEAELNARHEIVLVAAEMDAGTERIVRYLGERGISINVLSFQIFSLGSERLLSRAWLIDPVETQATVAPARKGQEPWNGEFYANFIGQSRDWEEARRYGFISGGGGNWYSQTLKLLGVGDRVWVKAAQGFVGVGRVTATRLSMDEFMIPTERGPRPAREVLTAAAYHRDAADPDREEYFVPVRWCDTVDEQQAVREAGMFGSQHTVCRPATSKWRDTVERLKLRFPGWEC